MNTMNNNTSKKLCNNYVNVYNPVNDAELEFIALYINGKCSAIFSQDEYPLITSKSGEELFIITILKTHYILKSKNGIFTTIYNTTGKKIIEGQKIEIISPNININSCHFQNYIQSFEFIISIQNQGQKTIIYNIITKQQILSSYFKNASFEIFNELYLEKIKNKIKAIYLKNSKHSLCVCSNNNYLTIFDDNFVLEYSDDNMCHSIYYKEGINNITKIYTNYKYHISLTNIHKDFFKPYIVILGYIGIQCKAIYFYNLNSKSVEYSKKSQDNNYFEFYGTSYKDCFIQEMYLGKCVKLLDNKFNTLLSILYDNELRLPPTEYFEIERINNNYTFVKMFRNKKCQAIYDITCKKAITYTNLKDVNIEILRCKVLYDEYIIFKHMLNNTCIALQNFKTKVSGLTYEEYRNKDGLMAFYGISYERKVAIYDLSLKCIVNHKDSTDLTVKIHDTFIELNQDDTDFTHNYQHMIFKEYYKNYKSHKVYDENNNLVLSGDLNNTYFESFQNYILQYSNNRCMHVYNSHIEKILCTSNNIVPYQITQENNIFFKEIDEITGKELAIYKVDNNSVIKIAENYEKIIEYQNYLIIIDNSKEIELFIQNKINNNYHYLYAENNNILKFVSLMKKYAYIFEFNEDKIVKVYLITTDGFEKILSNHKGIEIINSKYTFFKSSKKIYNLIGNRI